MGSARGLPPPVQIAIRSSRPTFSRTIRSHHFSVIRMLAPWDHGCVVRERRVRMPRVAEPPTDLSRQGVRAEQRYIALATLARRLASARDWDELTTAIAQALGDCEPAVV